MSYSDELLSITPTLMRSILAVALITTAVAHSAASEGTFYVEVEHEGRIHVFNNARSSTAGSSPSPNTSTATTTLRPVRHSARADCTRSSAVSSFRRNSRSRDAGHGSTLTGTSPKATGPRPESRGAGTTTSTTSSCRVTSGRSRARPQISPTAKHESSFSSFSEERNGQGDDRRTDTGSRFDPFPASFVPSVAQHGVNLQIRKPLASSEKLQFQQQ